MTNVDIEYAHKLLREAEDALEEITEVTKMEQNEFFENRHARYSLRYLIILVVEILADLATAVLEKDFKVSAESYRDAFLKLAEKNVVKYDLASEMAKLASLRNLLIHRYWDIDDIRIYREAKRNGIMSIRRFIEEMRRYVEA